MKVKEDYFGSPLYFFLDKLQKLLYSNCTNTVNTVNTL